MMGQNLLERIIEGNVQRYFLQYSGESNRFIKVDLVALIDAFRYNDSLKWIFKEQQNVGMN
jgi:hypothetical protein